MTNEDNRIFEEWFEEKKEKCEVYGNGDDFYVDDEIKKFCLMGYELGLKVGRQDEQLTKAKELLNEFMRISKASDEDFEHDYSELIGEAEQFIKDLEK